MARRYRTAKLNAASMPMGTGISIMSGLDEYADQVTSYETAYDQNDPDPTYFVDGSERTASGTRAWKLTLKGARDEIAASLFDFLWVHDGELATFTVADNGATYTINAELAKAPPKSEANNPNLFEVDMRCEEPVRVLDVLEDA